MTKTIAIILLAVFLISCQKQDAEETPIKAVYNNYKAAILNDKGEEAVSNIDGKTIKYYSDILEKVKTSDETDVNSLSFLDKFQVLLIRQRATKEEIRSFDGKSLVAFTINNGMVGKNGVSDQSVKLRLKVILPKDNLSSKGRKRRITCTFNEKITNGKLI